jgi:UDP-glucose 4-epimerase
MNILLVGGAGYIGSHLLKRLLELGHRVITLDNFSTGYRSAVLGGDVVEGDFGDRPLLDRLLRENRIETVLHLAAAIDAGESVRRPSKYYSSNVAKTLVLLDALVQHGVDRFVFASSAAVFGEPRAVPIDEDHATKPLNPYGLSKLIIERVLRDYHRVHGLKSTSLRYFTVAGADPDGELGERREPAPHLLPLVLQVASGRRECVGIFGDDYDTEDGTCVRDYVHVTDLCEAHVLALERLQLAQIAPSVYNLGSGIGYSVREVIACGEQVSGVPIGRERCRRRVGDPARLVADASRARNELGWTPRRSALETIMQDAWNWEIKMGGAAPGGWRKYA